MSYTQLKFHLHSDETQVTWSQQTSHETRLITCF